MSSEQDALDYHAQGRPGKISVVPTKPVSTQRDLSLAYSPGVAEPCREIAKDPQAVGLYTARRNLVAVVTNGTAVLGLGAIGPLAAKPVMEGKGVLFKKFADIDVFDIELSENDPDKLVEIIAALEPTFGGINLEDIKAPECFIVERKLRERLSIPVFHDDQHGTAIISAAALKNAVALQGKEMDSLRVVCLGAGAAAVACMELWMRLGVRHENIVMVDSKGVITRARGPLDEFKSRFARPAADAGMDLAQALDGADVFIGLSAGNLVTADMVRRMAERPVIMALANPDPEIPYDVAREARPDAIVATGRSDFPNQVNNVLGFPYIFRGALDVAASAINEEMKLAAALALAELARQEVPDEVLTAYGRSTLGFGPEYVIPTPFDQRVLYWVAPAVARAAMETGVARDQVDLEEYRQRLMHALSPSSKVLWSLTRAAKKAPKRIAFCEAREPRILRAAAIVRDEGIGRPVLVGSTPHIERAAREVGVDLQGMELINPRHHPQLETYIQTYFELRQRKGMDPVQARERVTRSRKYFGMLMLRHGDVDVVVSGASSRYPEVIRPALEVVGLKPGVTRAAGAHLIVTDRKVRLLADTTLHFDPTVDELTDITLLAADAAARFGLTPQVAMLSFSTFGSARRPSSRKMAAAAANVRRLRSDLAVDGEMQADVALASSRERFPFCTLEGSANVLIFPNLDAGNIAYRLLSAEGNADVIGPLMLGVQKPVALLSPGDSVDAIVHLTTIAASDALGGPVKLGAVPDYRTESSR